MNGNMEYEESYQRKIDGLLKENSKLHGFYSFIGDKSISTIYNYLLHVNCFHEYLNGKSLNELNVDDFSGYMMKIRKNKKGDNATSSYKIVAYSALKKYGKYLAATKVLNINPMIYIDRPKAIDSQKTIEKREKGFLEKEEIKEYIQNVKSGVGNSNSKKRQSNWHERDIAIINLFLTTGMRCSALIKIDIDNINFDKKTLIITDKESEVTTYSLTDETISILDRWFEKRQTLLNGDKQSALFISNRKKRIDQDTVSNIVKKYAQHINGKNITPHKLRATYGTQLYNATGDIYFVQKCMNHNSPKTTETYIRGIKNNTKQASDIMGKLL